MTNYMVKSKLASFNRSEIPWNLNKCGAFIERTNEKYFKQKQHRFKHPEKNKPKLLWLQNMLTENLCNNNIVLRFYYLKIIRLQMYIYIFWEIGRYYDESKNKKLSWKSICEKTGCSRYDNISVLDLIWERFCDIKNLFQKTYCFWWKFKEISVFQY